MEIILACLPPTSPHWLNPLNYRKLPSPVMNLGLYMCFLPKISRRQTAQLAMSVC